METYFAPAARTDRRVFANQVESVSNNPIMNTLLKATGGLLVVLNEDRQIVALNEVFMEALGIDDTASVLGLRLGETLKCIHANDLPHGCGTTPHCMTCGAVIAMMSAICEDKISERTCALTALIGGIAIERYLSVRAQPVAVDGSRWILIFAQDITQQHSLAALEHVFFHDINNTLTALACYSEMLRDKMPELQYAHQILSAAERLKAEVSLQRFLSNQKDDKSLLQLKPVTVEEIHKEVEFTLNGHPKSIGKILEANWSENNISICTDIHLVSRILGNMLLNAMEATSDSGTVRLNTTVNDTHIVWSVWNDAYIPEEIQLRIFQKHFSTKSNIGRGIGTHAMKLLGEKYLLGKVSFRTSLEEGTAFFFELPITL